MKWQSIPSWLIILLCCNVGAFFALWISLVPQWPGGPEPTRLPSLPTAAAFIYGFDTSHWFEAYPSVRTIDGQIFNLTPGEGESYIWQSSRTPSMDNTGGTCSDETIRLIEETAPTVIECRSVITISEWCALVVSITITENGEVWRLAKVPPCIFLIGINFLFLVPIGIVLGVVLVVIRKVVLSRLKTEGI